MERKQKKPSSTNQNMLNYGVHYVNRNSRDSALTKPLFVTKKARILLPLEKKSLPDKKKNYTRLVTEDIHLIQHPSGLDENHKYTLISATKSKWSQEIF